MENGKPGTSYDVPPRMNETLQQAAEYMRTLQARFDSSILAPGKQRSRDFANVYPVTAAFLAIFSALALVPVASFLSFLVFVLVSCTSIALGLAIGFTLFVGFWAGVFLFFTLLLILCFAALATASLLGSYVFYRFIYHIRAKDGQGMRGWANETKERLVPPGVQQYAAGVQQYAANAQKQATDYYSAAKDRSPKTEQL